LRNPHTVLIIEARMLSVACSCIHFSNSPFIRRCIVNCFITLRWRPAILQDEGNALFLFRQISQQFFILFSHFHYYL
jgi:hypothetical protein